MRSQEKPYQFHIYRVYAVLWRIPSVTSMKTMYSEGKRPAVCNKTGRPHLCDFINIFGVTG